MKIVVDTNLVFSALLNSTSQIGKVLITAKNLHFYSSEFLKVELRKHRSKLTKYTKLNTTELNELQALLIAKITFIDERLIPSETFLFAEEILTNVDQEDTPFVALATYLDAMLWTGDMHLYNGLKEKGFKNVITTAELLLLFYKLERKSRRKRKS